MNESEMLVLPDMPYVWHETLSWQPDAAQQLQFQRLYEFILSGNRQMNLTRITAPMEFWEKHLWDSLRGVMPFLPPSTSGKFIDIGTGAGFPGIPVAIALPNSTVTLLDATRKKIAFLETLISRMAITNATALTGRAEQIGQQSQHRQSYDIAFMRALGSASVCAEYALPFLKLGGLAILYRGKWTNEETATLKPALEQLGGVIEYTEGFTTPLTNSIRHCLYLRKVAPTPTQFPRAVGLPEQKPL